jgi:hypothetical protein
MRRSSTAILAISLLFVSACQAEKSPCDNKLVVLQGDGAIQVESQWDACVARNASKVALNRLADRRLAEIAVELCDSHSQRYDQALRGLNDKLSPKQVAQLVQYKQESLLKIAMSELGRARKLGCEAK